MSEYQYLTSKIQVPKEWPVEIGRKLFENIVDNAITRHRSGQRVVITVANVSAVVTKFENKPGYLLEKTEEINVKGTHKTDLIFPAKVVMLTFRSDGTHREKIESVQCLPTILKSNHFISEMLVMNPEFHKVLTVVPDIKKILKLKGITSPERYNHALQTTYKIPKIKFLDASVLEIEPIPSTSAGPSTSQEQVTDDEWDIVTYDRPSPPKRFQYRWKVARPWIFYSVILVIILLLIYLSVKWNLDL